MNEMVKRVAMVLYQEDGMKHASPNVTIEQSWDLSPVYHDKYLSKARAAIEAMRQPTERTKEALNRQCDNMAFVINHMTMPAQYYEKFMRELEEDRAALKEPTP